MISIISATNRNDSLSHKVSLYYSAILKGKGINSQVIDLREMPKDSIVSILYEENGKHLQFNATIEKVKKASKLVFVVPEYNGSFPGVLKVFIDAFRWPCEMEFVKSALVGVSSGPSGCISGLSHLTDILHHLSFNVFPIKVNLSNLKNSIDSIYKNDKYIGKIEKQINAFLEY